MLDELQKVCLDAEQDVYTLDLVEWVLSAGRRPVKRPLPSLRPVRTVRHLHRAAQRLGAVRLPDAERLHLTRLVNGARAKVEDGARARFGPVLTTALHDVGLGPTNAPDRVAFAKMVEELLDRVIAQGFLTFGDVRDALSRNQLKMPDLGDAEDFIRGDPLLRLDRRLAPLLDGVYRPSELYVRWLERLTALNFGTRAGRAITLWVTFRSAARLAPPGSGRAAPPVRQPGAHTVAHSAYLVLAGPWGHARGPGPARRPRPPAVLALPAPGGLGLFLMGLIHSADFAGAAGTPLAVAGRGLHQVLVALPVALVRLPVLRRVAESWPFQLLWWYGIKPAAAAAAWLALPPGWHTPT